MNIAAFETAHGFAVVYPYRLQSAPNLREHHHAKAARVRAERQAATLALKVTLANSNVRPPCVVTMTRVAPRTLDDDNVRGAFKATRDAVAALLGLDDRDERIAWRYGQRKGAPKMYAVEIRVERAGEVAA